MSINSIEQGFGYFFLTHHGRPDLATHLNEAPEMAPFRFNPDRIMPWVLQQVPELNYNFVCQSDRIYKAIMVHQLVEREEESEFKKSFMMELVDVENPGQVKFRVYNSNKEMIWSSGSKYGQWVDNYLGFHLYGQTLQDLIPLCLADQESDPICDKDFWDLLDNPQLFNPPAKRSVLVVADSQPRYVFKIRGGNVIPVSGGKYVDILNALRDGKISKIICEFKWVIIYVGTNVPIRNNYYWQQRESEWRELKQHLVYLASLRSQPYILFSCAFDHPRVPGNARHADFIERELRNTNIICLNWGNRGNPFLTIEGRVKREYFDDPLHLNHDGFRLVWRVWCTAFYQMRCIPIVLQAEPESVCKDIFRPKQQITDEEWNRVEEIFPDDMMPSTSSASSRKRKVYDPEPY
jgi:hypothetical protein